MKNREGIGRRGFVGSMAAAMAPLSAPAAPGDPYDFDTPYNRIGTDTQKWDMQIRLYGRENIAVGMGVADMDFRTAPAITAALKARMQHENWGYLDPPPSFIDAIVDWNRKRYGIEINRDLLLLGSGVHPSMVDALRTFSPPGSRVLLQTPTYDGFYGDISFAGCIPEDCPLKLTDGRYAMDFENLERRIGPDSKTIILCNPQNPTGNCWSRQDLTTLGEICTRRGVIVLADEIHCDLTTKGNRYTPYSTLANEAVVRNSITFKSASKSFNLSALKCSWMFSSNADYIARLKARHKQDFNTLGMIAARAALTEGSDWLDRVVEYIDGNHDLVCSFAAAHMPTVKVVKPQATYLAWLDVSQLADKTGARKLAAEAKPPVSAETMVERYLVKTAKVDLKEGAQYGTGGAGHMRMNIATSRKTLELALTNLAGALQKA